MDAAAYLAAANAAEDAGQPETAATLLREALKLKPTFAEAHNNLGIVLAQMNQLDLACVAFAEAIRLNPRYARAHANLATAQMRLQQYPAALLSAQSAVALKADYADAHHLQGVLYSLLAETDAAEAALTRALHHNPRLVASTLALIALWSQQKRHADAERVVRAALTHAPNHAELWHTLGDLATDQDDINGALKAYQRALELRPYHLATTSRAALILPNIYLNDAHLEACRQRYAQGVAYLHANIETLTHGLGGDRYADVVPANFFLAYQGQDDKHLQRRHGEFMRNVALRLMPEQTVNLPRRAVEGRPIRVGFCSRFFSRGTVGSYFSSWVSDLDPAIFDVFLYHTDVVSDDLTMRLRAAAKQYFQGVGNVERFSERIRGDALDVLIYPELGMDLTCAQLAALRLAPVQVAAWGHPVTPGHPMIDVFISCAAMEPIDAQRHYYERLLTLPGIGTRYPKPSISIEAMAKTRRDYQLPEDAHLYLFPQSLFKIHPANDRLVVTALANDPKAVLVMFAGQNDAITQKFISRLSAAFAAQGLAPQGRVKLLPFISHDDYKRVNCLCDLMLDTLHWSGGNTSLDALAMGLPIVTLPGEFMRGRQTMGMLTLLGTAELIAHSEDHYLAIASRLASDRPYRDALSARIIQNAARLFDDPAPTQALAKVLLSLATTAQCLST